MKIEETHFFNVRNTLLKEELCFSLNIQSIHFLSIIWNWVVESAVQANMPRLCSHWSIPPGQSGDLVLGLAPGVFTLKNILGTPPHGGVQEPSGHFDQRFGVY